MRSRPPKERKEKRRKAALGTEKPLAKRIKWWLLLVVFGSQIGKVWEIDSRLMTNTLCGNKVLVSQITLHMNWISATTRAFLLPTKIVWICRKLLVDGGVFFPQHACHFEMLLKDRFTFDQDPSGRTIISIMTPHSDGWHRLKTNMASSKIHHEHRCNDVCIFGKEEFPFLHVYFKLEATALTGTGIIWSIDPLHCTGTKHDQAIRKAALKVGSKAAPKVKAAAPKAVSLV